MNSNQPATQPHSQPIPPAIPHDVEEAKKTPWSALRRPRTKETRPPWVEEPSPFVKFMKAIAIFVIVLVMLYPIVYVIAMSFADAASATSGQLFPTTFSRAAYTAILSGGVISRSLLVTVFISIVGTLLALCFTTTMAYGLTRTRDVPYTRLALYLALGTMFFGAGLIPNFLLIRGLGLLDSVWSLILPGMLNAFNMIVVRNFFMEIPQELFDSARVDGASHFRIFFQIVLPLSKAVIAVVALFYAVGFWNIYFNATIYLNDTSLWPIQVVLNQYVLQNSPLASLQNPNQTPPPAEAIQMAVIVLATLPILVVYPFLQRYFTKGMLTGAIKG